MDKPPREKESSESCPYRRILYYAVSLSIKQSGFGFAHPLAIETLREILESFLVESAATAQSYCEVQNRTEITPSDIAIALADLGVDVKDLVPFARRIDKVLPSPQSQGDNSIGKTLSIDENAKPPSYFNEHLPPLPDSHTFVSTSCSAEIESDFERVRRLIASDKIALEQNLVRLLSTDRSVAGAVTPLFSTDSPYLLLPVDKSDKPYLKALLVDPEGESETIEEEKPSRSWDNPYLRDSKLV